MNILTFKNVVPMVLATALFLASYGVAFAATINVPGDEATLNDAVAAAANSDTIVMTADIATTEQVQINKEITLDGDGYTLSPVFAKTSNSNNSAIGVGADNVTIQNLTIDGSGGTNLHGINVYVSDGVVIDNVSSNHNRSGLVVNGSDVTVTDFSTTGNIWHGINVDLGSGVTSPAVLTVNETSSHGEDSPTTPHIFVDDTTKDVTVNDVDDQYWYVDAGDARAYTLKTDPVGSILEPEENEVVSGETDLVATYDEGNNETDNDVAWAVREGTCDIDDSATVAGNVAEHDDDYDWDGTDFSATIDTSSFTPGMHCFIFNPLEEDGQENVRETREFLVSDISASPEVAYNPVGTEHTVTADIGVDVADVVVVFEVDGVNSGSGSETTDENGEAEFTYTGDGGPGSDTITVCVDEDTEGNCDEGESTIEVSKYWYQEYTKISGTITDPDAETNGKGRGNGGAGKPLYTFDGYAYDLGSEIVGEVHVNYKELGETCTYTPGTFDVSDAPGIDVTEQLRGDLFDWNSSCGGTADIYLLDRDAHPDYKRGAIYINAPGEMYDVDVNLDKGGGPDNWYGLDTGNVHVLEV